MVDHAFMREALKLARRGYGHTSPNPMVGAVLVRRGKVIGRGWHQRAGLPHAEIEATRGKEARGASLYVTLEPCAMCAGAIQHARIAKLVYGASDPKTGACGSVVNLMSEPKLNHHTEITSGVLAAECGAALSAFFSARRKRVQ